MNLSNEAYVMIAAEVMASYIRQVAEESGTDLNTVGGTVTVDHKDGTSEEIPFRMGPLVDAFSPEGGVDDEHE